MDRDPFVLDVDGWVNSPPVGMAELRGRVVMIEAFQMLCPGCVSHGLPQATRVHRRTSRDDLVVIGLHTVFEHHDVMGPDALAAFVSEYRIPFPVAIDRPTGAAFPATMDRYRLQGTPTTMLVDRNGRLRDSWLGAVDDVALGIRLGTLLSEGVEPTEPVPDGVGEPHPVDGGVCRPGGDCT